MNILTLIEGQCKMIAKNYGIKETEEVFNVGLEEREDVDLDIEREERAEAYDRQEFYEDHIEPMWQRGQ